ncbi:ATPase, T2SS/T4P/T4SS family, partial [Vibrio fortis]
MFFKRKNINPEFEKKAATMTSNEVQASSPEETLKVDVENASAEKEKSINEARKALEQELSIKHYFHKQLLETLDLGLLSSLETDRAKVDLHEAIVQLMANDSSQALSAEGRKRVIKQIEDEVFGLGPLEPLLADTTVSDILVNGPKSVYVERRGKLEKTPYTFLDDRHLRNIIDRIVSQVGRRIDEASPMVDA